MIKNKKIKMLMALSVLLVPNMVFAETSTVARETVEDKVSVLSEAESNILQGVVNIDNLNVRSYPDVNHSTVIGKLQTGDQVRIVYKTNKFYKVYINSEPGFVYADYIDTTGVENVEENSIESIRDLITGEAKISSSKGEEIVKTAMQYLGTPYVYGGSSLTKGVDCSGFTQGIMNLQGIHIPRTSKAQSKTGQSISKEQMQAGDLLFFGDSPSSIFHTGIYIGNGQMIHASTSSSGGVIIADAFTGGGAPLQVIRRVY